VSSARRNAVWIAVAAAGLLLLVTGAWALAQLRISLAHGPMLREPFGVAVAPDGALLVGVAAARVHVYAADGRFVRSFRVPPPSARFRLRAQDAGRVEVATADGRLLELALDGTLVSERSDAGAYARFGAANDAAAEGPGGERYALRAGALARVEPAPARLIAPALRWPLAGFADFLPAIALALGCGAAGLIGGVAATGRARRG
jgi:hypothetical protein